MSFCFTKFCVNLIKLYENSNCDPLFCLFQEKTQIFLILANFWTNFNPNLMIVAKIVAIYFENSRFGRIIEKSSMGVTYVCVV